jgi:hypothetical protein
MAVEWNDHHRPEFARRATTDWVIAEVGDFNGDGKADIMWRNITSGTVYEWVMYGTSVIGQGSPGGAPTVWQIQ